MLKLFMIADDLTGALDSGIKFSEKGLRTLVIPDARDLPPAAEPDIDVLVVNANSRGMSPPDAYTAVYRIGQAALEMNAEILYKKVDSALRGNIGSELNALVDLTKGKSVFFAPAYPAMKRVTVGGVHYIDGVPLDKSVFADDPFNPTTLSYIPDILARETAIDTKVIEANTPMDDRVLQEDGCIHTFDAESQARLYEIASYLKAQNRLHLVAGCAGFAGEIARLIGPRDAGRPELPVLDQAIVICGSLNPITTAQITCAISHGAAGFHLSQTEKTDPDFWLTEGGKTYISRILSAARAGPVIVDTSGKSEPEQSGGADEKVTSCHKRIAASLGMLAKQLARENSGCLFVVTGGDTLMGFIRQMDHVLLKPVCEIVKGAVLFEMTDADGCHYVISKSGGFCEEDVFVKIFHRFLGSAKKRRPEPFVYAKDAVSV